MRLSNKTYNFIKYLITIFLPAVGAFYFGLAQIWGFPNSPGVNGTINLIVTFLGILIGFSTYRYNRTTGAPDGDLIVIVDEDGDKYLNLGVNGSVEELTSKETVTLKVVENTNHRPETLGDLQ